MKQYSNRGQAVFPWVIAFLVWPLGAFLGSLRLVGYRVFSIILILFYFLYGFTYIISGKDQDTYRISQYFEEASKLSFADLWSKIINLYALGNKPDIFQDILQFSVSRFTTDVQIYFAIIAVLLAIITASIFERVVKAKTYSGSLNYFSVLLLLFLLLVLSPGRINSFRHYFALAIFLFSTYNYIQNGQLKYLFLLCLTPFVHFAFVMVIPLLLVFKIVGSRFWVYYLLILASFIFTDQVSNYLRDYTAGLDENALQYHATQYTSDYYLKQVSQLKSQRYFILDKYIYFTTIFFLTLSLFSAYYIRITSDNLRKLFSMTLLIFAFVNFFSELESVANRFGVLYQGFCCIFLIQLYFNSDKVVPLLLKILLSVVFLVNLVIIIRITMQSASVSTILLFLPVSLISPLDISLLDWIK